MADTRRPEARRTLRDYLAAGRNHLTSIWRRQATLHMEHVRGVSDLIERVESAAHELQVKVDGMSSKLDRVEERLTSLEARLAARDLRG